MHLQSKDPFSWEDCGLATGYTTLIDFVNPYGNVVSTCWRRLREGTSPPVYREMGQHGQGGCPCVGNPARHHVLVQVYS